MSIREFNTRIKSKHDTTANWNAAVGFIPLSGEIIIYDDYETKQIEVNVDNELVTQTINIPNIKIGTGNAYVQDLPFVDDDLRHRLLAHINDTDVHVTLNDKAYWSNKINLDDTEDILYGNLTDDMLIITRD